MKSATQIAKSSARAERAGRRKDVAETDRVDVGEDQEDREHHADVADDVDDERLARGGDRRRPLEPEPDQEVRRQADEAPADEQSRRSCRRARA